MYIQSRCKSYIFFCLKINKFTLVLLVNFKGMSKFLNTPPVVTTFDLSLLQKTPPLPSWNLGI